MNAIVYGAGNIGRGFIGVLFSQAGYKVTFIDVVKETVERLHNEGRYPVRIVSSEGFEDIEVVGVDALDGRDAGGVAKAIAEADIMAVAVGVNVLKNIVPNIAEGLRRRFQTSDRPLNILICENLMDANRILEGMLKEHMAPQEHALIDERVGLVETSIGRMVPIQTAEMRDGDDLRISVERYSFLPVDKDAFKGEIPRIAKLVPYSPFGFYLKRKLYIHNMGHCICAYLGMYTGEEFICDAIEDSNIQLIVKNAMLESMEALAEEYSVSQRDLLQHIDDLLLRFTNRALGDTCARVGRDTHRKLSPDDRLIGAARLCMEHHNLPVYIAVGIAGALHRHILENGMLQDTQNAVGVLQDIAGLYEQDELTGLIMKMYDMFRNGTSPKQLRREADKLKKNYLTEVI